MALKTYTQESEVPTELKSYYVQKDGKWEPQVEGIDSVSSIAAKNRELLGKNKEQETAINQLTADKAQLTNDLGARTTELSQAQSQRIPTGNVAVPKKDADLIAKLKEQDLTPETVLSTLNEVEGIRKENAEFKLSNSIAEFAEVEKIANVKALGRLIKQDGVTPTIKEVEENGTKVKRGFLVAKEGEQEKEHPYSDYKTANWGDFVSALDAEAAPRKSGTPKDPDPKGPTTPTEKLEMERVAQAATGRYSL